MTKVSQQPILSLAIRTGELLLKHGAETYRVEDTILHMCRAYGIESECFATPSVIIVTGHLTDGSVTLMRRVKPIRIDLHVIDELNCFARDLSPNKSLAEASTELEKIAQGTHYPPWVQLAGGGLCAAGFAVMFGAPWVYFPLGFLFGVLLRLMLMLSEPFRLNFFLRNLMATFIITMIIFITDRIASIPVNPLIIGAIMQVVPGVAITNSIRDTISGDFLSGMTRASEAVFIALGIAFGVGVALMLMTGGKFL